MVLDVVVGDQEVYILCVRSFCCVKSILSLLNILLLFQLLLGFLFYFMYNL